jgi:capsule polysaccharide export protein KpsE/RkpR
MFNLLHINDFENIGCAFFNQFNKHQGFNCNDIQLAILLEKQLSIKGKFKEFKKQIESEFDSNWEINAVPISTFHLKSVLQIAKSICHELDIYSIENQLTNAEDRNFDLIKLFETEIKEYLTDKNENYRLIFIVDDLYPNDFSPDVKMFQIKDLLDKLTSLDSRISVIISSPAVDESNPINLNMVKLRDRLFRHRIHLQRLNKI